MSGTEVKQARGLAPLHAQFVRFIAVGIVNTVFGYGIYYAALTMTGSPGFALLVANILGYAFNFQTTRRIVFRHGGQRILPRFVMVGVFVYCANLAMLDLLIPMGVDPRLGQILCLPPTVIANFVLLRRFVFTLHLAQSGLRT